MPHKTAVIIGAGPAGLTAAYELLDRTGVVPVILEADDCAGGISRTVNFNGNRMDIGGHRFFSKSERVMKWWLNIMPLQGRPSKDDIILKREIPLAGENRFRGLGSSEEVLRSAPDPEKEDNVMLYRQRISRILFLGRFFSYPVTLSADTVANLGPARLLKIAASYLKARVSPPARIASLEDFFISRFGRELYETFFKDYTEKVWGIPCNQISPEWGAQRVKGLSAAAAVLHAAKGLFQSDASLEQKKSETSLINRFMYPKYGPGQLWQEVARQVAAAGGRILFRHKAVGFEVANGKITAVLAKDEAAGTTLRLPADYLISSMPVRELIKAFGSYASARATRTAQGLLYRDFITAGILLKKLKARDKTKIKTANNIIPDNWIYVQEPEVKMGRIQIFNNWSPYLVSDSSNVWLGTEYFCNEGDALWNMQDKSLSELAISELNKMGLAEPGDVMDSVVVRMPKAYPAYFGTYNDFKAIREFTDNIENLFLVGRNGMHRYNNMDHSMLSAMSAVDNISGKGGKADIWNVNAEEDYHES